MLNKTYKKSIAGLCQLKRFLKVAAVRVKEFEKQTWNNFDKCGDIIHEINFSCRELI